MNNPWGHLIRENSFQILTPNIVDFDGRFGLLEFDSFRKIKGNIEWIPFFEFSGEFYYPLAFEFRGINNNLLYLIEELGYSRFSDLAELLESSMQKEEGLSCRIKAAVIKINFPPVFSVKLPHFIVD